MKKITLKILFLFFVFTNLMSAQVAGISDVKVNNKSIDNCSTIALGLNTSVTVTFTLKIVKNSSTDVGTTAKFKIFLKKNNSSTPVELNGIIVNNSAFSEGGTTWEGTFSQIISASDIEVSGSTFYAEYSHASTNSPAISCTYNLTKTSPTFEISPTSQVIYCQPYSYTFSVNNVYDSPGTLSYKWWVGYGWSRNNSPVPPLTEFTTTTNSVTLNPTDFTVVPSSVTVVPVLNGVDQVRKTCTITRSGFSPTLLSISGSPSICYQSSSAIYSIPDLYNGLSVTWSSSNNAVATVTNSGNQAVVVPVSKGTFILTGLLSNECGQTFALTKKITIVGSPAANYTGERVERYVFNYRGQDLYNDFSTFTWEFVSSTGYYVDFRSQGDLAVFTAYPPFSITMKLTATNACGSVSEYVTQSLNSEDEQINKPSKVNKSNTVTDDISNTTVKTNSNFNIYPNPSNGEINIRRNEVTQKPDSKITAVLYDINGNRNREIKIIDEITTMNVQGLSKGIYFLKINNNGKEETNKIVIE
ncbi:T9SS type A sorting domain-containing protein [Flavobacterium daemonense]|uniref:T9SS type A sorting domain-containing protein n=1 Tax=Flavobacterium daemonense TaxID=1393049 RepID=UPI001184C58A|nr:T9SS type A sorting domain-containing protein [Flavobacterium daemonense]KAF2327307.1 T9SS type A sorting domain-containing protein [Flavobacterium daemonense]